MKNIAKVILVSFLSIPSITLADSTIFQPISRVQYNGDTDVTFFVGSGRWGASSCPNATYVQIKSSVAGRKQLLSIGLTAQVAGKNVQFWGTCDADPDYFNAVYVVVQ